MICFSNEVVVRDTAGHGWTPPEIAVGHLKMCGYSAMAITEAVRKIMGDETAASTVLGYFEPDPREYMHSRIDDPDAVSPYHYWTELTVGGKDFFCCATYAQYDLMFAKQIIFDERDNLKRYGLYRRYSNDVTVSPSDLRTLAILEQNGGNLPLNAKSEKTAIAYDRLVRCLTDDPEHAFFK